MNFAKVGLVKLVVERERLGSRFQNPSAPPWRRFRVAMLLAWRALNLGAPEATIGDPVAGNEGVAARRTQEPCAGAPAAATQQPVAARRTTTGVGYGCGRIPTKIVLAPFKNITVHVVKAIRVRTFAGHLVRVLFVDIPSSFTVPCVVFQLRYIATKTVRRGSPSPAGPLPLRLGRQTIMLTFFGTQFLTKLNSVVPTHMCRRTLGVFFDMLFPLPLSE